MSNTAIKVEHLYKEYKLGVISHGTLYRDMQSWWAKIRGKEDPNSLVSFHHDQQAEKDSFLALDDVSFEVKEGDRVGIIGKNGAGKSTLLKILSQITSPTKGNISIRGRVGSLLEVGTGFHSELTGRENIFLNGSILGMARHEISKKLDEIVDFAGIEKHLDTPVKRYSSGMMVRLGFAVAAHLDTDILIADEVLAVGDAEFQKKALGKMQDLSTGQGRTILFVSHNMAAVKNLCKCGILLEQGKIKLIGQFSEAIREYLKVTEDIDDIGLETKERVISGDILRCTRIEILNADKKRIYSVLCGQKTIIRIYFTVYSEHQKKLNFGISLKKKEDNKLLVSQLVTTRRINKRFECKKGVHFIDFIINKMPLSHGTYIIDIGVTEAADGSCCLDWIQDAFQFKIENHPFYEKGYFSQEATAPFFIEFDYEIDGEQPLY